MSLLDLIFRRKPTPGPPKNLRWFPGDASFRAISSNVAWTRTMLAQPEGQRLQAYLFSQIPQSIAYRGDEISVIQGCQEYFRLIGYLECLSKLQEAAVLPVAPPPELEADYDQTPPPGTETNAANE